MKRLFLLLILVPIPAQAAFTLKVSGSGGSSDGSNITVTLDTTGSDLILVGITRYGGASFCSFSDSRSNSYTNVGNSNSPDFTAFQQFFYVTGNAATISGTSHSFTCSGSGGDQPALNIITFSGANTALGTMVLDQMGTAGSNSSASLAVSITTPIEANEVVVAVGGWNSNSNFSSFTGTGFTVSNTVAPSGTHFGTSMVYSIQTTAAAATATLNLSTATQVAATMASFRNLPVAGGPKPGTLVTLGVGK